MLAQTPDAKPGPKELSTSPEPNSNPTLAEIGVSKKLSSTAQQLAAVPLAVFADAVAQQKAEGVEITTTATLKRR